MLPSNKWVNQTSDSSMELKICKLGECTRATATESAVVLTFIVKHDKSWSLHVHGTEVTVSRCPAIGFLMTLVDSLSINELLQKLDKLSVCPGHPDEHFMEMAMEKGQSNAIAIDESSVVSLNGNMYGSTLRVKSCHMLVTAGKCSACASYRGTIRKMYSRWKKSKLGSPTRHTSTHSRTNFHHLTASQMQERMKLMRTRLNSAERQLANLKRKIEASTEAKGVMLDEDLHQDLADVIEEHTASIHEEFPEGSFRRLFWDQQREALKVGARQMRWHPTLIRWCLSIKLRSSGAYEALRNSGFIFLPSSRTLRDYTHSISSDTGFQVEVARQLISEAKLDDVAIDSVERYVTLLMDEVRIKDSLVYDKHSFRLIGLVDIGKVNNELIRFEQSCDESTTMPELEIAKYMLVFMVRGICTSLKFPFAQFATKNMTADLLFPLVWETIQKLELLGLKVIAVTCDGASQNRSFFQMHANSTDGKIHKTINPYADKPRYLYFFADVSHLIKTVRNCMSNSFSHSHSRALWVRHHFFNLCLT